MTSNKVLLAAALVAMLNLDESQEIQMPKEPDIDYKHNDFLVRNKRNNGHPLNPRGQK